MSGEEGGVSVQVFGISAAVGVDSVEGLTVSFFASASVGVSADGWQAINMSFDNPYFFEFEPVAFYAGAGTPTGVPGPNVSVQTNLANGNSFLHLAIGVSDLFKIGVYAESPKIGRNDFFRDTARGQRKVVVN